jgi:TPP-dependent pyruvate/acetoin dehydrogenase alpha subunit
MYEVLLQSLKNRYFEYEVAKYLKANIVNPPVYLSVGTEFIPPLLIKALKDIGITRCDFFTQHRCHSYFLTLSEDYSGLVRELCGNTNGCNNGYAGSASLSYTKGSDYKMWGHSGLLGDQIPIACGAAHASNRLTICVLGDAAAEEDYALAAFGYAVTKKCPILFICEDNDLSLLTTKAERRSWDISQVVKSMGIVSYNIERRAYISDIYETLRHGIINASNNIPSFINIEVYRHLWHAGAGQDGPVQYDWLNTFQYEYKEFEHDIIQKELKSQMEHIWQLEIQSKI